MRHVRDGSQLHLTMLQGDPPAFRPDDPFDNREAPLRWLARTTGEQPSDTIRDLEQLASAELDALTACVRRDGDRSYVGPYGPAHWTVLTTHGFWDSWLHERDITQPLDRPQMATLRQDLVAALYGLLVASIPAAASSHPLNTNVRLTAASGRPFDIRVEPRRVTLQPARPDEVADLAGELGAVVDSPAGRRPAVEAVLAGDPAQREPFTWLRRFMVPSG